MKKEYIKPQIMVESLMASEYYAGNCSSDFYNNPEIQEALKYGSIEDYLLGMGFEQIEGGFAADGIEYCYHSSGIRMMAS